MPHSQSDPGLQSSHGNICPFTLTVPPPPDFTPDQLTDGSVSVVWDSPEDSGIVIVSYELSYKGDCEADETVTTVLNGSVFHYELTGLRSGTNYTVSLRANNSLDFSTQTNTTLKTLTSGMISHGSYCTCTLTITFCFHYQNLRGVLRLSRLPL